MENDVIVYKLYVKEKKGQKIIGIIYQDGEKGSLVPGREDDIEWIHTEWQTHTLKEF